MADDKAELRAYLERVFKKGEKYKKMDSLLLGPISLPEIGEEVCAACRGTGYSFIAQTSDGIAVRRDKDGWILIVQKKKGDTLSEITISEQ